MTTLVRFREPLRNAAMNGEFERLIKTIFESPARAAAVSNQTWAPPLDVWETEGELVYAFDLPGVSEEKIVVDLEDSTLTVSGSRERTELEDGASFATSVPSESSRALSLYPRGLTTSRLGLSTPTACSKSTSRSANSPSPAASRSRRPSRAVRPTSLHRRHVRREAAFRPPLDIDTGGGRWVIVQCRNTHECGD